ncbi:MAG: hypothetical protein EXR98_19350 [Gemmataceae bacterium]|nr:hypothetical protein [Gemmataceae bacterium]
MVDTPNDLPVKFAETREHEYQAPHYHDEESVIANDEGTPIASQAPAVKKKMNRRLLPARRHYEE